MFAASRRAPAWSAYTARDIISPCLRSGRPSEDTAIDTQKPRPEFDGYAGSYAQMHARSLGMSGEGADYFAEYKVRYIRSALEAEGGGEPGEFLDFGCGIGGSLGFLGRYFPDTRVHGADVSGESVEFARHAAPEADFTVIADARLAPIASDRFDAGMAACVFHHIPPPMRAASMSGIRRVLRPGGRFFVFEHNPLNPLTRRVVANCEFDEDAILLSRGETEGLLRDAGFEDVRTDYIVFFPKFLSSLRGLERGLSWLPLGAQYVTSGCKPSLARRQEEGHHARRNAGDDHDLQSP